MCLDVERSTRNLTRRGHSQERGRETGKEIGVMCRTSLCRNYAAKKRAFKIQKVCRSRGEGAHLWGMALTSQLPGGASREVAQSHTGSKGARRLTASGGGRSSLGKRGDLHGAQKSATTKLTKEKKLGGGGKKEGRKR